MGSEGAGEADSEPVPVKVRVGSCGGQWCLGRPRRHPGLMDEGTGGKWEQEGRSVGGCCSC